MFSQHVYLCITHVCLLPIEAVKVHRMESQVIVSPHEGAGNQLVVLIAGILSCWAISPAPLCILTNNNNKIIVYLSCFHASILPFGDILGHNLFYIFFILYVWVFCFHVYLCTICAQCLWRQEEGTWPSGTGVTDHCEPPCRCWELNLGSLEKQQVLLPTEPSLQPLGHNL